MLSVTIFSFSFKKMHPFSKLTSKEYNYDRLLNLLGRINHKMASNQNQEAFIWVSAYST